MVQHLSTAWALTACCCAVICLKLLWNKYTYGLTGIPGPRLAAYTDLWRFVDVLRGRHPYNLIDLHRKHGPLVRIGPKNVSIADSDSIKVIYSPVNPFVKSEFYDVINVRKDGRPHAQNVFAIRDEKMHTQLKRPVASLLQGSALKSYEDRIDTTSRNFYKALTERFAETGDSVDLGDWVQFYAFDVIGEVTFSKPFGFIDKGRDIDDIMHTLSLFVSYAGVVGQLPFLHNFLLGNRFADWLLEPTRSNPSLLFAQRAFRERDRTMKHRDVLSELELLIQVGKIPPGRDFDTCMGILAAGSDTTAIALRSILNYLLRNPRCYRKLQQEVDDFSLRGLLSSPVKMSEATKMPYLQACIKEGMRLHPSVGFSLERVVPQGGASLCDHYFPAGTVVGVSPFVSGQDKSVYGEDVDTFRPERWILADSEQLLRMERNNLSFGAGKRLCLGKQLSLMEMSKVIPELFRRFDVSLENEQEPLEVKVYWFAFQKGLICKLKPRVLDVEERKPSQQPSAPNRTDEME